MKEELRNLKEYFQKRGVGASIFVTIFTASMLLIALFGNMFYNERLEFLCVINLCVHFFYGTVTSYMIYKNRTENQHLLAFLILNWFIGCFSLNLMLNVFENLPFWVYLMTFLFCLSNFFVYSNHLKFSKIAYFSNGFSILLILYYTIYLIPIMPYSALGILALGMGFYGLVPLIVLCIHLPKLFADFTSKTVNIRFFMIGLLSSLTIVFVFSILMSIENNKMSKNLVTKSFDTDDDLPTYIKISEHLNPNFFNEIILKKGIVYFDGGIVDMDRIRFSTQQFNERKKHDPLINVAFLFIKEIGLSNDDRINLLKTNFDKRLETEEQLWNGTDLETKNIKEDVKIFPANRLAYTELTVDVFSNKNNYDRNNEAIYSFQLPEGAVATSLSLWVNGEERKGVLTTKQKAESAYKQIVGVEARDPSLMQWREGNRVVVRIFPINYALPRTFKCGFTTPLIYDNNQLTYKSLQIKGPNTNDAETISRLQVVDNSKFESSKDFELQNNFYINESKGLDDWQVVLKADNQFIGKTFVWEGNQYTMKNIERQNIAFDASEIIIDLNKHWTLLELQSVVNQIDKKCFVFVNKQKVLIDKNNYQDYYDQFKSMNYNLLPIEKVAENGIIITKNGTFSPNFEELKTSKYLSKIKNAISKNIKTISINNEITPFWQTVKEQKIVDYHNFSLTKTIELINKKQFVAIKESDYLVNNEVGNFAIEQQKTTIKQGEGLNHIYRLFAFGKVLSEQVKIQNENPELEQPESASQASESNVSQASSLNENEGAVATEVPEAEATEVAQETSEPTTNQLYNRFVNLAEDANIVTPITSLIVLETDADYEKNGIEKNVNTLGNANINNDGAVPEPHEWAMIIVSVLLLGFYYKRRIA